MKTIALSLLIVLCSTAFSQQIETDRPDQTESSAAVPKGTVQIETGLGVEMENVIISGASNRSFILPTSLFRVALMNKFELRIVNTFRVNTEVNTLGETNQSVGIDDLEAGFKFQFTDGEGLKPQMALMSHLVIPSGSSSSKTYGLVNKLLISHVFSDRFSLGYNLGHVYFGSGNGDFVYSLALGFSISDKVGAYIENYGELIEFKTYVSNFDAGLTYLIKDNIQLDYSFGLGMTSRMNYQAIGISMRFPN